MSAIQKQFVHNSISKASKLYESLRTNRPSSKSDLKNYVKVFLGLDIPEKPICKDHCSPLDYLYHSFFLDFEQVSSIENGDCIVWANRAGGKTQLAAAAALLDCIFKPNCKTSILAGSGEQASRMYEYFLNFLTKGFDRFLAEPPKANGCCFKNNSQVQVLTQSPASVRGRHIQKLRCDEIELFEPELFNAAKFITQSYSLPQLQNNETSCHSERSEESKCQRIKDSSSRHVETQNDTQYKSRNAPYKIIGAMEIFSTMHKPYGLMQKIVSEAQKNSTPIFKWCVWETIEKCTGRTCSQCPIYNDCRGKAKNAAGYIKIDDIITHSKRSSRSSFESEMLCKKPSLENVVFDEFDPDIHVREIAYDPNLPLYRTLDFGFVNPFVCLWIQADEDGSVRIIDEYLRHRAAIHVHAENIKAKLPYTVQATFCDPAGQSPNDVTGTSAVRELKAMGIPTRYRQSQILEGIELIRRALRNGSGKSSIIISPKCSRLIQALQCYHYPDCSQNPSELPLKDGIYDHPIDALRYFFVNYNASAKCSNRRY
ncbi:MAG: hypothetical protein WCZ89_01440 [Phycisphaerae bacterium]